MNDKNLFFRYFFYFLISFFLIILFLDFFKEKEFETSLKNYKQNTYKEYLNYYNTYMNNSELIYFNEFIKNKKTIQILKSNLDLASLKKEFYEELELSLSFYSILDLDELSIYNPKEELIFSLKDNLKDNFTSKVVQKVVLNKKEEVSFKILEKNIYILFSKPIFDEKLNFLGVVNIEFKLETLIKNMKKDNHIEYKEIISNDFNFENIIKISEQQKKELINNFGNKKEVSFIIEDRYTNIPVVFIPIFYSDFYKNSIYLMSFDLDKKNQIEKINSFYNKLLVILNLIAFFIIFIIYKMVNIKSQRDFINKKYENIFEQVDNYIIKVDLDLQGNVVFATKSFYKVSGYSQEEIIGKNINLLRHPDMSNMFFKNLWATLKIEGYWQGEIKNRDKFGNTYWIKSIIFPRYNLKNEIVGYSSIRTDITDTKQFEKINKLLKEDLSNKLNDIKVRDKNLVESAKVALMSKILDSLGHQWKVPISRIFFEILRLKNLKKDDISEKNLRDIEKNIESELKSLSDILNEIKYIFNPRKSENSNLLAVANESLSYLKNELEKHNIEVKLDIDKEIHINILFAELKNIIINILKNCIEQVDLNRVENVKICVSAIYENMNDNILIKIEDNIKSKNKKIILDEILSSEEKYFDTSIYLAKLLIEKNSGLFWCKNSEDETKYYIKLTKEIK
ncbi:PAS domain S-box protein [Arcobacter lacus]|uniref:PAS domain-containing sensor histidine kinase n=1 Tax=Arcobacter lacus TaxID=1912876 RepID=UPI0021BB205B|nr:PAS domain S-box protein [Arcobacter lacus]MCT7908354.1 PAS domain S-box protein [Arcobacter lacus]